MKLAPIATPVVQLAADLGSSASKLFYRVQSDQCAPIWMGAEVADGLSSVVLSGVSTAGRPQDMAWLELDEDVVMVGEAAKAFLEMNSLSAKKYEKAVYKLVAALGVIADIEQLPSRYQAVVWLALPLGEFSTQSVIVTRLRELCQKGFTCRGKFQQVELTFKCYPEGFGLYLIRKQHLSRIGQEIEQRRTTVMMMGHRNLSLLAFDNGTLNMNGTNSDGPGFWPLFEKGARSSGVITPDYPALMRALSSGDPHQVAPSHAGVLDFSEAVTSVQTLYRKAVMDYLRDNLLTRVTEHSVDVVISGGASRIIYEPLVDFFEDIRSLGRVEFIDGTDATLTQVVSTLPEFSQNPTLACRMADGYGLFLGLIGSSTPVAT
jgi:hypothetical protein